MRCDSNSRKAMPAEEAFINLAPPCHGLASNNHIVVPELLGDKEKPVLKERHGYIAYI